MLPAPLFADESTIERARPLPRRLLPAFATALSPFPQPRVAIVDAETMPKRTATVDVLFAEDGLSRLPMAPGVLIRCTISMTPRRRGDRSRSRSALYRVKALTMNAPAPILMVILLFKAGAERRLPSFTD